MRQVYARLRRFALTRPRRAAVAAPFRVGFRRFRHLVEHVERRPQLRAQPARLRNEALVLRERLPLHLARLGARLAHDHLGFAARLLLQLGRRALRGDERRAKQRLELAEAHEVLFEAFDLVAQVRALTPDVLEARRDLVEETVDGRALVAEEPGARHRVSDHYGCPCPWP